MKRIFIFLFLCLFLASGLFAQNLAEKFSSPDQTIEYHFMLEIKNLNEKDISTAFQSAIVEPLKEIVSVGALGKFKPGIYIDSRSYGLEKQNLIVRVRTGQITIKARASSPDALLDLEKGTSKKYEMDYFGTPDYSISTDIKFPEAEFDIQPSAWTPAKLWDFIEKKSPAIMKQIQPAIQATPDIEIPGVAHMYSANIEIKHPLAQKLKEMDGLVESGLAVWFFPPTDSYLVELAYTAKVKAQPVAEQLYYDLIEKLKSSGLYASNQISKTQQYFAAYFGPKK